MSTPEKSPEVLGRELAEALERRRVDYAISGAIAFAYWGAPRATKDVDVALYAGAEASDLVADAVESIGAEVDRVALRARFAEGGTEFAWHGRIRIDLFAPSIPFEQEAFRTRVRAPLDAGTVWIVSAEALCVFKLLFFRSKDIPDLERIIGVQGPRLDRAYVRRWVVDMMGDDDERVRKWDELVREVGDDS